MRTSCLADGREEIQCIREGKRAGALYRGLTYSCSLPEVSHVSKHRVTKSAASAGLARAVVVAAAMAGKWADEWTGEVVE